MIPSEIWVWIDSLNESISVKTEEDGGFFFIWRKDLIDEILQGRGIIANMSFKGGRLDMGKKPTLIYGCLFKNGTPSFYPLAMA